MAAAASSSEAPKEQTLTVSSARSPATPIESRSSRHTGRSCPSGSSDGASAVKSLDPNAKSAKIARKMVAHLGGRGNARSDRASPMTTAPTIEVTMPPPCECPCAPPCTPRMPCGCPPPPWLCP
eukprot:Amastigsp_a877381_4.p3 type:complete len:124 gc:universal Amastigsp_a877381_4:3-374(+)